jgi:hypothetical protein
MIEIRHNLPEFKAQLAAFGQDFEKRTVRAAANAAAQVFKKLAVSNVRQRTKGTGLLARSMYVKRSRRGSTRGQEHYIVGFRQGKAARAVKRKGGAVNLDAFYGRFLEYDWIPRGRGKGFRGGRRSRALQRERALSSGAQKITKYRFLAPAFTQGKDAALKAFFAKIEQRIAKENAKRSIR